jgi:hypothetical protein
MDEETGDDDALQDADWGEEVFRYVKDIMGLRPADAMVALTTALGMAMSRVEDAATKERFDAVFHSVILSWRCDQMGDFPNSPQSKPGDPLDTL